MRFKKLEIGVIDWALHKGILTYGDNMAQGLKTLEEVNEMLSSINNDDVDQLKDDIGDVLVTIIIQAEMNGLNILDCLEHSVNEIQGRDGKMINGTFVKNS